MSIISRLRTLSSKASTYVLAITVIATALAVAISTNPTEAANVSLQSSVKTAAQNSTITMGSSSAVAQGSAVENQLQPTQNYTDNSQFGLDTFQSANYNVQPANTWVQNPSDTIN